MNYTGVLTAEQGLHQVEDQLAQTRAAEADAADALYTAMGGGWADLQEARR